MTRAPTTAIWVVALIPGLITLFTLGDDAWRSTIAILQSLGRLTGVWGLSFLLMASILSCRVPGFDVIFGGLTKLWYTHHLLAAFAFLLLLAHPLLLAFASSGGGVAGAVEVLLPEPGAWDVWSGWAALVVMMIFLAPSFAFFGEPAYQRWKFLHRLAAVAVVLALVHAWYLGRSIPHPWDYWLWGTMAALAVAAMAYRFLFSRFQWGSKGGRLSYEVIAVNSVSNNVVELSLRPRRAPLNYSPGQFVYLTAYDRNLTNGYGEEHPYTISSAPGEDLLRITIKDLGDASRAIQQIEIGSEARIEGPYGAFFPATTEPAGPELWIAGGIGITPFLSRARHLRDQQAGVDIVLIYCVQDEARALFAEELAAIDAQLPGFRFNFHYFYREGPISETFIQSSCPDFSGRDFYVCGPPPLIHHLYRVLHTAGIPGRRIETEEFNLL